MAPIDIDTRITIAVPSAHADRLAAQLAGPQCWNYAIPDVDAYYHPIAGISAHQRAHAHHTIQTNAKEVARAIRAAYPDHPDWMPIAKNTALSWVCRPHAHPVKRKQVGLSVVRLLPATPDSWARRFPGTIDAHGWWEPSTHDHLHVGNTRHGWGPLAMDTLGTDLPWAQYDAPPTTFTHHGTPTTVFRHQWQVENRPVRNLVGAMRPILDRYGACALDVSVGDGGQIALAYWSPGMDTPLEHHQTVQHVDQTILQPVWPQIQRSPLTQVHHELLPV